MAEAVVLLVTEGIKPLGDFIVQQAKFLSGVSYQVELAQVELHLLRGFLRDADARQGHEEVVRIWVKLIRDAAYDLEDVIASFALKVAIRRRRGGGTVKIVLKRFGCIFQEGVHRYKIGSEIEDIMTKLSHLRSSLQSYNIRQTSDSERAEAFKRRRDRRLTYGHEVDSHIVGLEENTDKLVKELVREGKSHLVVSIWGMGGSGKTTLAKQVFQQPEIKRHFDCVAWVCISQQWEGKDVLEDILVKLTSPTTEGREEISKMKKDQIAQEVCRIQREKRCLVILDDIWTQEAWSSIKAGFPINEETESRMLLTTRKKEVASSLASGNDHLHQPRPLDGNQSWELFEKIAISGRDKTDSVIYAKKREIGEKMLVHCSGLPLAIRVLAGFLSRREKVEEWELVSGSVDKYIMRGTNVLEKENTGQDSGVAGVLALSYDDLPSQLKFCFLYLAQFPEDREIPVKQLIQLWIAEGFITSTSDIHGSVEIMEDEGYSWLVELVERSMVQVANYGLSGKVKTCRLHDLMRDLCLQKAKEENFLDVVDFSVGMVSGTRLNGKFRRLAIYLIRKLKQEEFSSRFGRDDRIRSMLCFSRGSFGSILNKKVMRSIFNDFKLLRVLKFENILVPGRKLPKTIGDLVHLRFLSLRRSLFDEVPSSVSNLVLLQTLDLRMVFSVKIRCVFCNMEQLRHLYLPGHFWEVKKESLSRLCNLQTLVNISLDRCDLNDFVELTKLRKLGMLASKSSEWEELNDVLISRNVTYQHLQSLSLTGVDTNLPRDIVLRCPYLYKLRLCGIMRELPRELLGYPNLTKITLLRTDLKDDQIEVLEKLPKLRVLFLGTNSIRSERMVFSQGGFPHLESLTLWSLDSLKEWKVERGAMPCLHRLNIHYCEKLVECPDGLQDIKTLKELTIDMMPRRFCSRVGEGGEDFYKIKHVPSLIITNIRPDEREKEEAAGASQIVSGQAGDISHQESTVDAHPGENTDEIQASSHS